MTSCTTTLILGLISAHYLIMIGTPEKGGEDKSSENGSASDEAKVEDNKQGGAAMTASSLFTSAIGSFGFASSSPAVPKGEEDEDGEDGEKKEQQQEAGASSGLAGMPGGFSTALNTLGKVAADATQSIKDKVTHANMLAEFNKEQDSFIKSKGEPGGGIKHFDRESILSFNPHQTF